MLNRRKTIGLIFALATLGGWLAGCTGGEDKKYVIATDTTFAPFEFTSAKGIFQGVDLEILSEIAKDQGFEYELRPLGFDAAVAALESNQADGVIAGMSITPARQLKYNFSDPYYSSHIVMAVRAKEDKVAGYKDLQGKTVAVKTGTEGAKFAESLAGKYHFQIKYFLDSPTMYQVVKSGNAVACFEDAPVMAYGISQNNGLKLLDDTTEKSPYSPYGFAVLKSSEKNQKLLALFQAGLANIKKKGKLEEIFKKYNLNAAP